MLNNRYDFVVFFDVTNGNPNGDPDNGNAPRVDSETGHGLVTDVCIKRKIRNYVSTVNGFDIFVKEGSVLNDNIATCKNKENSIKNGQDALCKKYYDIRAFGAVLSTGDNPCGKIQGPVQLTFGQSLDPIVSSKVTITRCAVATQKESKDQNGLNQTIGNKHIVPYALYKMYGFINAPLSAKTGFGENDLEVLWSALQDMFELDRSASRGMMSTKKIIIWKHESPYGNANAYKLFNLINVKKLVNIPRKFEDYSINVTECNFDNVVMREVE